jgi:signal transduction histidine kinase
MPRRSVDRPVSGVSSSARAPSQRAGPSAADRVVAVPSPLLTAAARRAAAAWALANDGGEATAAAAADVLGALASSVYRRQSDPDAPLDPRAYAPFAPRLLALLRAEVIAAWPTGDPRRAEEVRAILTAIEGVCAAVERDPGGDFAVQFAGPQALDMLVAVAHDLRSPLTSILFLADTLERGQSGPVTEVQRRQLALIYGAALGLCAATSDIVELARGGNGLVEQEPVPFAVSAVLDSVRDIVRPIAAEKGLEVRLAAPTRDQRCGHPVALSRVLLNLTTNALKFTETGYVEIAAREDPGDRVEFAVQDTGKGIAPEVLARLYQPWRRVPGRPGPLFSQAGLGLLMCRKLVAAMGAALRVETAPGRGTRFAFALELPPA